MPYWDFGVWDIPGQYRICGSTAQLQAEMESDPFVPELNIRMDLIRAKAIFLDPNCNIFQKGRIGTGSGLSLWK